MCITTRIARAVRHADSDADETYECKDCGATFPLDRQTCPDCDCCRIDRIDWNGVVSE